MSIALFNLARNLKFSRFAIDVLLQRLEQLLRPTANRLAATGP